MGKETLIFKMGKILGMSGTAVKSYEKGESKMYFEILLKCPDFLILLLIIYYMIRNMFVLV